MNKTIFIIAITLVSIVGLGYFLTSTNPGFKTFVEKIGIIATPKVVIPESYNAVFVIFDPSGSGRSTYSVPRISVKFINALIDSIEDNGSGDIWLTFISRNAYNNDVLHLQIPKILRALLTPMRRAGETLGEFKNRLKKFKIDSAHNATEIRQELDAFKNQKNSFLQVCESMIHTGYAPKKPGQDYSDIIGSLNTALRAFSTVPHDSTHFRSILLISDGVQDVPKSDPHQSLNQIPKDIRLIEVNHGGSAKDILAGKALEIDNLDERAIKESLSVYKPKNQ